MKWALKKLCVAITDLPVLKKTTFKQQMDAVHQSKPWLYVEKNEVDIS